MQGKNFLIIFIHYAIISIILHLVFYIYALSAFK